MNVDGSALMSASSSVSAMRSDQFDFEVRTANRLIRLCRAGDLERAASAAGPVTETKSPTRWTSGALLDDAAITTAAPSMAASSAAIPNKR